MQLIKYMYYFWSWNLQFFLRMPFHVLSEPGKLRWIKTKFTAFRVRAGVPMTDKSNDSGFTNRWALPHREENPIMNPHT